MNASVRALADETSRGSVKRMFLLTFRDGDALKPTRQGVTIPLERLPDLAAALTAYLAENASSGPLSPK